MGEIGKGVAGLRIAVAGGYFARGGRPESFAAVDRVATALGATRMVEFPEALRARSAGFIISAAEGGALHAGRLRTRFADFDPEVRNRLVAGAMIPASVIVRAQKFRRWHRDAVMRLFEDVDVILAPAAPCRAPASGQKTLALDGVDTPLRANIGVYTQPVSFIGLPVVAAPVWSEGEALPIGVQVIAAPWREEVALRVARALEEQGVCRAPVADL
jgi:aspartyl-tRNA(Asn)/glutamyl-tRNA(Gln) amidotransferase subunit A